MLIALIVLIALIALSACDGGDLPLAYRDLEVPQERLVSVEALKALDEEETWDVVAYVLSIAEGER